MPSITDRRGGDSHMRRFSGAAFFVLFLVAGCERYSLDSTSNGQVLRLDRQSGAVAAVSDAGILPLREVEAQHGATAVTKWPVITLTQFGGVQAAVTTRWRDGKILYRLAVRTDTSQAQAKDRTLAGSWTWRVQTWTLNFVDSAGFKAFVVEVPMSAMTRIQGDSGNTLYYEINDSQPLPSADYLAAKLIAIQWRSS